MRASSFLAGTAVLVGLLSSPALAAVAPQPEPDPTAATGCRGLGPPACPPGPKPALHLATSDAGLAAEVEVQGFRPLRPESPTPGAVSLAAVSAAAAPAPALALSLGLAAIGLYHRIHGPRSLRHPLRASILGLVQAEPGLSALHVARRHGVALHTALYHVKVLERTQQLRVQRVGRAGLLFPAGMPPRERAARAALHAPLARGLLSYASVRDGFSIRESAARLGVSERSTRAQAARLLEHGLLVADPSPGGARFWITPEGRSLAPSPVVASIRVPTVAAAAPLPAA